jgi:RNA polymerase sigma-70 factor (ECF subfamily)
VTPAPHSGEWRIPPAGSPRVVGSAERDERRCREAFAEHVVPEIDVLLRVARTLVPRPADAEDLVQDTLLRAYRSIDSFDGRHPRAWLLTIMRNARINRTRRRRPELLDDPDAVADRFDDGGQASRSPEATVVGETFDAVVVDALEALPDRFRQVVELVDIGGLSYAEAAEALAVPVGTVMSRLHRARTRIRSRLAAAGLAPARRKA